MNTDSQHVTTGSRGIKVPRHMNDVAHNKISM